MRKVREKKNSKYKQYKKHGHDQKRVLPISVTDSSLYLGPIFSMSIVDERWPQALSEIVVERVKDILNSEVL